MMFGRADLRRNARCSSFVVRAFRTPSCGRQLHRTSRWRTADADNLIIYQADSFRPRIRSIAALSQSINAASSDDMVTSKRLVPYTAASTVLVDENSPVLQGLNPSQVEAVTQPVASVTRVVAGPGSGKTRVLTSRIAWLLQQSPRDRILGVTFTRKASGEMQERLHKLLIEQQVSMTTTATFLTDVVGEKVGDVTPSPTGLDRVTLGTFHSVCAKILRWNGDYLVSLPSVIDDMSKSSVDPVLDGTFNIADQGEQIRVVKESLLEYSIDLKPYDLKPLQVLSAVSRCKAMLTQGENPFAVVQNEKKTTVPPVVKIAQKIYYLYREKLLSTNCIDFDDLIYLTREMLLVNEDVRDRLQKRWNHGKNLVDKPLGSGARLLGKLNLTDL